MTRRRQLAKNKWLSLTRQVHRGLHDNMLPIYGNRGAIGLALWDQAYTHLCQFPGLMNTENQPDT